jgi:alpha-D-ribose 1-methylphosphonate 5-triphosphate diphosphatase PhnM
MIADYGEGASPERGENLAGDLLMPGLVELHTDHLEAHYMPRPGNAPISFGSVVRSVWRTGERVA